MPNRHATYLTALLILALFNGCADDRGPEQRVRSFIDQVVASAQARAWRDFDAYLTTDFTGARGLTRQEALGVVMRYILGHRSIHIFHRVRDIEVYDAHHARAVILAALAGSPVSGPDDLAGLNADLYRFELDLTDAGNGFQVSHGAWQPVGLEALLSVH